MFTERQSASPKVRENNLSVRSLQSVPRGMVVDMNMCLFSGLQDLGLLSLLLCTVQSLG